MGKLKTDLEYVFWPHEIWWFILIYIREINPGLRPIRTKFLHELWLNFCLNMPLNFTPVSLQVIKVDFSDLWKNKKVFLKKWTSILYIEATTKKNGCLEVQKMAQNKPSYSIVKVTLPGVGAKHCLQPNWCLCAIKSNQLCPMMSLSFVIIDCVVI